MFDPASGKPTTPSLPEPDVAREWLAAMTLIRRFEERAGEMYARAKIGGFLHLAIGEEATIVGSCRALATTDYLVSTYRSHGDAIARGTPPERVMAELFGKAEGCSKGHGGSMHMFDAERRFMGGYGIVGGNLPIAAGIALACDLLAGRSGIPPISDRWRPDRSPIDGDAATLCTFGDGATNQGTFGETLNLAALWKLPVVFMVINNQFGMGTSLARHSAVTDLQRKGESLGVPGMRCDGMDVLDTYTAVSEALARVREERCPLLVEAVTYRFRGHSMADPEDYRTKEEVAQWRERDPLPAFASLLEREGMMNDEQRAQIEREAGERIDAAVRFAEDAPFPDPHMLYEDVYVMDGQAHGHYHADGSENERRVAAAQTADGATVAEPAADAAAAVQERT